MRLNSVCLNKSGQRVAYRKARRVVGTGSGGRPIRTSVLLSRGLNDEITMGYQLGVLATCAIVFACVLLRRRRSLSTIRDLPGPVNPSWIFGMSQGTNWVDIAECETFKGTSGISRPEKPGLRIRGSSRSSGTSFVGTVRLGYVSSSSIKRRCLVFSLLTEMTGACAQEDRLWIADPKAINHILQKSGYLYAKPSNNREQVALLADRNGIASAEGESPTTTSHFLLLARLTIS